MNLSYPPKRVGNFPTNPCSRQGEQRTPIPRDAEGSGLGTLTEVKTLFCRADERKDWENRGLEESTQATTPQSNGAISATGVTS
jgi:hypothetical protein